MRIFFLSDLHLSSGESAATKRFETFLHTIPRGGDTLILGGDIFDLFIGDKCVFRERFRGVLSALRALGGRGITTYYLEGNHDFHLAGLFADFPQFTLKHDSFALPLGKQAIWVSHGDLIDPEDKGYRFLRWVTRWAPIRGLIGILPGAWIDGIGRKSSRESRKYNHTEKGGPANQARLRALYLDYAQQKAKEGFRYVLVGHSHLADHLPLEGGEYLNLGFSAEALFYGVLTEGEASFSVHQFG